MYIPLIKFRTSNHKLPIEVRKWENTSYAERKCSLCNKNDIRDEFHYLLICPFLQADRCYLLKSFYYRRPILKFKAFIILTITNKKVLSNLSKFVKIIIWINSPEKSSSTQGNISFLFCWIYISANVKVRFCFNDCACHVYTCTSLCSFVNIFACLYRLLLCHP